VLVDAHVHLLPERLASKIRRFFEMSHSPRLIYPHEPGAARAALAAAGVERCWSLPYAHKAGVAAGLNAWMAATWGRDPFVVPGATVHPDDDVAAVVREAVEGLGLHVFKIHCSVGAFAADDPRLDPLWTLASETSCPVVVHGGSAPEGTATADEVAAVGRAADRFPDARIIVAHFGAPAVERVAELIRRTRSVYADLTPMVATPVKPGRTLLAGIERRVLFGSDTPTVGVTIESSIERVRRLGLSSDDERAILGGTAEALLAGTRGIGLPYR
jgi:predicted TIM-barrel fold metal-dependent hydrolase